MANLTARLVRARIMPAFLDTVDLNQFGGRPKLGTAPAALLLQAAISSCRARSCSFAVLFVDLAQAFYSAIREFIFGTANCDERFLEHLAGLGCPRLQLAALAEFFASHGSVLRRAG
eukprot:5705383-Lingulodinium_polyedra.AAC.2